MTIEFKTPTNFWLANFIVGSVILQRNGFGKANKGVIDDGRKLGEKKETKHPKKPDFEH